MLCRLAAYRLVSARQREHSIEVARCHAPLLEAGSAISSESCRETERLLERLAFFCDLFCRQGGPRGEDVSSVFEVASLESLCRAAESCAIQATCRNLTTSSCEASGQPTRRGGEVVYISHTLR